MRGGLGKDRHRRVRGKNAVAVARKDVRTLVLFVSFRVAAKTICEGAQLRAGFDTDAVKLRFRLDSPQWPKLLCTAAASSLATLFVARNFFPTEKKVRHPIRANYVGDEVFPSYDGSSTRTPLCEREQSNTIRKRRSDFPSNAEPYPFGSAYDHV